MSRHRALSPDRASAIISAGHYFMIRINRDNPTTAAIEWIQKIPGDRLGMVPDRNIAGAACV